MNDLYSFLSKRRSNLLRLVEQSDILLSECDKALKQTKKPREKRSLLNTEEDIRKLANEFTTDLEQLSENK